MITFLRWSLELAAIALLILGPGILLRLYGFTAIPITISLAIVTFIAFQPLA